MAATLTILQRAREEAATVLLYVLAVFLFANIAEVFLITPLVLPPDVFSNYLFVAVFGGLLVVVPAFAALFFFPGAGWPRHISAIALGFACSLSVASAGGSIAQHFIYFIAMVFLATFLDWRVLATFTFYVLVDHIFRGYYFFNSVFGCQMFEGRTVLSVAAQHAGLIAMQLVALLLFINQRVQGLVAREKAEGSASQAARLALKIEQAAIANIVKDMDKDLLFTIKKLESEAETIAEATTLAAQVASTAARTAQEVAERAARAAAVVSNAALVAAREVKQTAEDAKL